MFAIVQNGEVRQIIQPDMAFTVGEKQYSARFIRNATPEERKAAGVYEIIYGEQKDQRFYWVDGPQYRVNEVNKTVEATFKATPKALDDKEEVDAQGKPMYVQVLGQVDGKPVMVNSNERLVTKGLKSNWIAQAKNSANSQLAQTDWMVIRKIERGVDIPAGVVAKRAAIVSNCAKFETDVAACTTVEQLIAVVANQNQ